MCSYLNKNKENDLEITWQMQSDISEILDPAASAGMFEPVKQFVTDSIIFMLISSGITEK